MQIIGLTGQARAGKSFVAKYIAERAWEKRMVPVFVSFAGALKRAAAEAGHPKETDPMGYRAFCQTIGAQARQQDPYHWVKLTMKEIADIARREQAAIEAGNSIWERVVIIDDVRYRNEVEAIIWMGGLIGHICAGSRLPEADAAWRSHDSEQLAITIDETKHDLMLLQEPGAPFEDFQGEEAHVLMLINDTSEDDIKWLLDRHMDIILGLKVMEWEKVGRAHDRGPDDATLQDFLKALNNLFFQKDPEEDEEDDTDPPGGWRPKGPKDR
jgi:hypothetical protein